MINVEFDCAYAAIAKLVQRFQQNDHHYLGPRYQESEARIDFIDKFWIALGWDVNHEVQRNPYEQEVKVERSVVVGAGRKRADYAFYLAPHFREGDVQFFVEAKKPLGTLGNPDNCFQLIRYGWSNQAAVSVLFSFSELLILDCRSKPDIDTATEKILQRFTVADYLDKEEFAKIYWLFSREAVSDNSLAKYAASLPGAEDATPSARHEYQRIDTAFLAELDRFRELLAAAFKAANAKLTGYELTEITQRTLDRLVFMRFLEDKLIEPEPLISKFGKRGSHWRDFISTSRRLDGVYNGIVFKKHGVLDADTLNAPEEVFAAICSELSDARSPYDFNSIPIHILGSIYESFLGKVIVVSGGKARVELKPEVRKAGGVYYTPESIVHYMVDQTVAPVLADKTPTQIADMGFADIACGSGSFLLGVFDSLLRYHSRYYGENPAKARRGELIEREDGPHLSLKKKREILVNNIFGIDVDAQAVEVAQLSLYLKLLADETRGSVRGYQLEIGETLLPSLNNNIVCGNSLVEMDILEGQLFDPVDERKLNPINLKEKFQKIFARGGFNVVLGNPPYVDSEWMTQTAPIERAYCARRYKAASGNWDLFCAFIDRAAELTAAGGYHSLIVPNKLASATYAAMAREVLAEDNQVISLRDYSEVKVFPVSVYPIIYVARKGAAPPKARVLVETMAQDASSARIAARHVLPYQKYFGTGLPWQLFGKANRLSFVEQLAGLPKLSNPAISEVWGAATVAEAYRFQSVVRDAGQGAKLVNSGTIDRYTFLWGIKECRYLGARYLTPTIPMRDIAAVSSTRARQTQSPKIVIAGMTLRLECALDSTGSVVAGKSTTIVLPRVDPHYLLAILNSKLVEQWYEAVFGGNKLAGGYLRVGPPQISEIPIVPPHINTAMSKKLIAMAQGMESLSAQLAAARSDRDRDYLRNKCAALDKKIDECVEKLYGVCDAPIATKPASIKVLNGRVAAAPGKDVRRASRRASGV